MLSVYLWETISFSIYLGCRISLSLFSLSQINLDVCFSKLYIYQDGVGATLSSASSLRPTRAPYSLFYSNSLALPKISASWQRFTASLLLFILVLLLGLPKLDGPRKTHLSFYHADVAVDFISFPLTLPQTTHKMGRGVPVHKAALGSFAGSQSFVLWKINKLN